MTNYFFTIRLKGIIGQMKVVPRIEHTYEYKLNLHVSMWSQENLKRETEYCYW